jgi:hypothetical protein
MSTKIKAEWVVAGGADGELGHCTRCGQALRVNLPQPLPIVTACFRAFLDMHKHCEPGEYIPPVPKDVREWRDGRDTGVSSQTIYSVFMGVGNPDRACWPWDPSDFGRCYRLLKIAPDWRKNLHRVAESYPHTAWVPLIREWAELEKLYEEELPKGTAPKLYQRMKELIAEAQ